MRAMLRLHTRDGAWSSLGDEGANSDPHSQLRRRLRGHRPRARGAPTRHRAGPAHRGRAAHLPGAASSGDSAVEGGRRRWRVPEPSARAGAGVARRRRREDPRRHHGHHARPAGRFDVGGPAPGRRALRKRPDSGGRRTRRAARPVLDRHGGQRLAARLSGPRRSSPAGLPRAARGQPHQLRHRNPPGLGIAPRLDGRHLRGARRRTALRHARSGRRGARQRVRRRRRAPRRGARLLPRPRRLRRTAHVRRRRRRRHRRRRRGYGLAGDEIVFVGSSRLASPSRLFLGSTANRMLRTLPVPLIVVPA